jgi:tetratricopeptide (TPR) repeat protein
MRSRSTVSTGSLILVLALSAPTRSDEVALVPGSTIKAPGGRVRGQVQSESPGEVVVKLGAGSQTVPVDQVTSIRYDGQPASLALAESRAAAGQLAEAAELYKKAAAEAAGKPLIAQAAQFHQAKALADLALADPGRAAEAIGLLESFAHSYPTSRHLAAALEGLARLQVQKGEFAQVERTIAELAKLPRCGDRAAVLRARAFARQDDHARAIAELDRLIAGAPDGSARKREARLAKAESLAGQKKFREAEADLRAVIEATPAEDFQAQSAAYNTLGDCLRAAGQPKDALLAYLHTDILYPKDREQHPRALARIAQLWRELKRDDYADEAWQRLKQEYPKSPWLLAGRSSP